jgi:hypothetical protein
MPFDGIEHGRIDVSWVKRRHREVFDVAPDRWSMDVPSRILVVRMSVPATLPPTLIIPGFDVVDREISALEPADIESSRMHD